LHLGKDEELVERTKRIADDTIEGPALVPTGDLRALLASLEALHAEREKLAYHAEQLATYIAQPTISEKHLASARWHNDKIRAALSGKDSPDAA
jgi:hypothetical protein